MIRVKQLELEEPKKTVKNKSDKEKQKRMGRWGILILLLVTSLISLILYLKQKLSKGIQWPKIVGVEEITFTR